MATAATYTEAPLLVVRDIYYTRERIVITAIYILLFLPIYCILTWEYLHCAVYETRRQLLITMLAGLPIVYYCLSTGPAAI